MATSVLNRGRVVQLKNYIRDIKDFPKPGIIFKDVTPILKEPLAFREAIRRLTSYYQDWDIDLIAGIDARGFLIAAPMGLLMSKPIVPVRKEGKLPYKTHRVTYELEYGVDTIEIHEDAIDNGNRVLIVDDLLATGGTMLAATKLVEEQAGGHVVGLAVLVELTDLHGRDRLQKYPLHSLIEF